MPERRAYALVSLRGGPSVTCSCVSAPAIAPAELPLPEYVKSRLGRRDTYVLDHGFDARSVGPDWWKDHLRAQRLNHTVRTFPSPLGERLTRANLFELGRTVTRLDSTDDQVLVFLWHVLAWGTGPGQRGNIRRIQSFAHAEDRIRNTELLREAARLARFGDPAAAYRALIRRGGGQIPGLGPAFFTKYLYFASEGTEGTRALILDARVAGALARAGWSSLPRQTGGGYSYNWYTATYASYCHLLHTWAAQESEKRDTPVYPDEIERALFQGE